MANPNKRIQKITNETVERWAETVTSTAEPDVGGATKLLKTVFPNKKVFTARTPLEFYLAQAILRGRVTKKVGLAMAKSLNLDPAFIKPLRHVGGPVQLLHAHRRGWQPSGSTTMLAHVVSNYLRISQATTSDRKKRAFELLRQDDQMRAMGGWPGTTVQFQLQDLQQLYWQFTAAEDRRVSAGEIADPQVTVLRDWRLSFSNTQTHIMNSVLSLSQVISEFPGDVTNGVHFVQQHRFDAIQAEIMAKALNCHKDPDCAWLYEIFHYVPGIMQFNNGFLLLSGKPVLNKNSDNELHNESGPAVTWADGHKAWFIGGHRLSNKAGEKIVMAPETLTKQDIESIQNEEERRIAIDRMGWNRYLTEIGARVAHSRENWVDNTFEVLIDPPKKDRRWGGEEPLRMVLSCRSTGRKYFIAVPREVPVNNLTDKLIASRKKMSSDRLVDLRNVRASSLVRVTSCEDAQQWFSEGATTKYLEYAKYPMNVIGAS